MPAARAAVVCTTLVLLTAGTAAAQVAGFRLTGSVESTAGWREYTTQDQRFRSVALGSRYAPNIDGWVLDPRLFTISYSGSLVDQQGHGDDATSSLTIEPYRLLLTAFPYGLHTFTAQAGRSHTELDFQTGTSELTRDTWGVGWAFRGGTVAPEAALTLSREIEDESFLEGTSEQRTRSRLAVRLHKAVGRFQPTLTYTGELLQTQTTRDRAFEEDGIRHHVIADDRIRVGERSVLSPLLELRTAPEGVDANAGATLTVPVSPSLDASGQVRYSFFERDRVASHTTAAQGELTKRFTEDYVVTGVGFGTLVSGDGAGEAWSGGGVLAFRAAPVSHLRSVVDYSLQLSQSDGTSTLGHRGHVNAVSTMLPRHTLTADYFIASTTMETAAGPQAFEGRTLTLSVDSRVLLRTTLNAGYALDVQDSAGHHRRHTARLDGEHLLGPGLSLRGGAEAYDDEERGGGRERRQEQALIGRAGVSLRPAYWLQTELTGHYGIRDLERDERPGRFVLTGITGAVGVNVRAASARVEGFLERDEDLGEERRGARGHLSYRFRVWTITADFEFATFTTQGIDLSRQRAGLRITRPLDFVFP